MPATWMSIEPVLMIWSSGSAALELGTGAPALAAAPARLRSFRQSRVGYLAESGLGFDAGKAGAKVAAGA